MEALTTIIRDKFISMLLYFNYIYSKMIFTASPNLRLEANSDITRLTLVLKLPVRVKERSLTTKMIFF